MCPENQILKSRVFSVVYFRFVVAVLYTNVVK